MSPGRKDDTGKLRADLLAGYISAILDECLVLSIGAKHYGDNNWQKVENAQQRYLAALLRHLFAYMSGEKVDPDSGISHLAHIRCNAGFLDYFDKQ
jgi:hypothetical protein